MYTVTKEIRFEAAHQIKSLPATHQCSRMHGHSYRVVICMKSRDVDDNGFVIDFGVLSHIVKRYDHQYLNDLVEYKNLQPSAENIAKTIYELIEGLLYKSGVDDGEVVFVRVHETETAWAEYSKK